MPQMQALVQQESLFILGVVIVLSVFFQQILFALLKGALDDELVVKVGRGSSDRRLRIFESDDSQRVSQARTRVGWLTCTRYNPSQSGA